MKLAVMQPYLFPYIGYFQLIHAADLFLIYDDVTYIKQGYINRNSIRSANGVKRFTVPVPGASSNRLISELAFSRDVTKVLKTIEQSYSKAPYFENVFPIIHGILEFKDRSIASVCQKSFNDIFSYLCIERQIKKTSDLEYDRTANPRDRLISLCRKCGADCYINAPGGRKLYEKKDFAEQGISLKFLDSLAMQYSKADANFVANLSIVDVLMHCSASTIKDSLDQYELN